MRAGGQSAVWGLEPIRAWLAVMTKVNSNHRIDLLYGP